MPIQDDVLHHLSRQVAATRGRHHSDLNLSLGGCKSATPANFANETEHTLGTSGKPPTEIEAEEAGEREKEKGRARKSEKMQPTQSLLKAIRKLPLTTKDIKKGFYKGTRTGSVGRHTKHGGYIVEWDKVRTYVVPPDIDDFKVRSIFLHSFSSPLAGTMDQE